MRGSAILGVVAISCAGCALESSDTAGDEPATSEGWEALSQRYATIATPTDRKVVEPFPVPQGGSVAVEMAVRWSQNAGYPCLAPAVTLVLTQQSPAYEVVGGRSFFPNHAKKTETWSGLAKGSYFLSIETNNDNPACVLHGQLTATIRP